MASTNTPGADGRQERFLRLFLPEHDRLSRFARVMTRDRDEARDLVGDTVLAAYEHFDDLADPKAFVSWLFTIARRIAHRGRRRRAVFGTYDEEAAMQIADPSILPDDAADLHRLAEALARLPGPQREAVTMFEIAGLSLEEIRTVQGGTLSGVKSRVARGRQRLAELLGVVESPVAAARMNGHAATAPAIALVAQRSAHE